MNECQIETLKSRNSRIIDAIIKKSKVVCPDSVAFIGITGSFCIGDIHGKSDLDLLIVINDDEGWGVASCFILGDVAHDLYCTPWERLESMSEYNDPYIIKLLELGIVYCADEKYMQRYLALRKKVQEKLAAPLSAEDVIKTTRHFENAMKEYANVMMHDDAGRCKYYSARMLWCLEYVIYMANKAYVKRGIKRIPEEIGAMKSLPDHFLEYYHKLIHAASLQEIQTISTALIKNTKEFLVNLKYSVTPKKEITLQSIRGSYEEIYSNWRNKMQYAFEKDDHYLSLMTMTSCQNFYDEMFDEYNIPRISLFDALTNDLIKSAKVFDSRMESYRDLYVQLNAPIQYYETIDAFELDYLKQE